ncbi:hypothetical protein R1flu_014999 [Riccia fluitans]|uniref:Uncharacterized protein n=1 Tax=Riccia fluitans TaxID=41844 RepID=A0ABD1YHZ2_9MARC
MGKISFENLDDIRSSSLVFEVDDSDVEKNISDDSDEHTCRVPKEYYATKISRGRDFTFILSSDEQEEAIRQSDDVDKSREEEDVSEPPLTTKKQKGKRKLRSYK